MNYEMEQRKCAGCGKEFKVLSSSPQTFHSADCEESGNEWEGDWTPVIETVKILPTPARYPKDPGAALKAKVAQMRPNAAALEQRNKNKETAKEKSANTGPTPKPPTKSAKQIIEKTSPFPENAEGAGIRKIKNEPTNADSSGIATTKKEPMNTLEITTKNTEKNYLPIFSKQDGNEDHTLVSTQPLKILEQEELHSLNSINESTKVLQQVMGQIVKSKENHDIRTFSSDDIHNICMIAGQVVNLLKVKTEVLKVAKNLV
jgi:hypothetical protein